VLFDGYDIRRFTLESLRAQISIVLQETILLRGTVAYNIAYGREGSTLDEVVAAAKQANAHDFIMAMPDGYDTVLGERAATLSGGQRQRLAIARAFIRDTPILIMDEPTTGLDAESSHLVGEALRTLSQGRTTVIVSHDLSLIRDADRILVISAGRVLEEGTSADLMVSGGIYAQLYARQYGEEAPPAAIPAPAAPLEEPDAVTATFESGLTEATPLPASRAQFQALTGWAPVLTLRAQPADELDPLRSPGVTRLLPGLGPSLDVTVMTPQLQRMLADPWVVDSCAPGKAFVEPETGATLRYRLRLRHRDTGEVVERLVGGRLFTSEAQADAWVARCAPLADALDGREDLQAFARTTSHVRQLGLVMHAFPLDPDLPGLVRVSDPRGAVETLAPVVDISVSGLVLQDCHVEVVRYGRRGTCVLRYELKWRLGATRRNLKQVLYGKVYADRSGELVGPAVSALRRSAEEAPGRGFPFLVPRLHGYLPDLRFAVLDALPGAPLLSSLVRDSTPQDGASGLTLDRALHSCARVAAALHDSAIPVGETRTLEGEIARARSEIESISSLAPELASTLHDALAPAVDATREPGAVLGVAHGDLVPAHVLLDGPVTSVVSFDSVCLAEPALDLGQLVCQLDLLQEKARALAGGPDRGVDRLISTVLAEYVRVRGVSDAEALAFRIAAYRSVAQARLAVRLWCELKPERVGMVVSLLKAAPIIR
jgi:energy-coupling factor transporter ATP-binding protein EcfA2